MRRFIAALFAFALCTAPAMATPPVFNGNVLSPSNPIVNAAFYGVKCNGSNDDTTAAQNAIAAAAQLSASKTAVNVLFPGGTCQFSSTLTISMSNVVLVGQGSDMEQDTGTQCQYATTFKWIGTSSNSIVQIAPTAGPSGQELYGSAVQNVCFTSNTTNKATHALEVRSVDAGNFENLFADSTFSSSKFYFGVVSQLAAHTDDQRNLLLDFSCTGASGDGQDCLYLDGGGTPVGNFSMNTIVNFQADHYNGNGITCNNADNNVFINTLVYRSGGGSGYGVDLKASCASNTFLRLSVAPTSSAWLAETGSSNNTVYTLDVGANASPQPTIQSGATLTWSEDTGVGYNDGLVNGVVGENRASVMQGESRKDAASSLYVYNASADAVVFDDGTNTWKFNINGSNGFRITQTAGTSAPFTLNGTLNLGTGSDNFITSNSTGSANAFVFNANAGTPTTGDLADFRLSGTNKLRIQNNGAILSQGAIVGLAHQTCSASTGIPCWASVTCSLSAATSCSTTTQVISGSICTATANGANNTTGSEWFTLSLSSTTLTVTANVASSQTATAAAWITCL